MSRRCAHVQVATFSGFRAKLPRDKEIPNENKNGGNAVMISRRNVLSTALAAPAVIASARMGSLAAAQTLKVSHQFPGGTIDEGDFRDRLCKKFAAEVEKRTNGAVTAQVYPNSSLMKTVAQFSAVRKGALDLSLYPISYAGGEYAELNIGLMPGVVSSYAQGAAWKTSAVGQKFSAFLAEKGVIILSWIWQAGGVASRNAPIVNPQDAKGLKIRGGSREMDMVLQAAGATTLTTPSNELYAAMQTGACDACITSSTSLISFRLEEVAKSLTTGRGKSYWFMLEPLIMSKQIFDAMPKAQRDVVMALGAELEQFGTKEAMADDQKVAEVYLKKGAKVADLDEAIVEKWRAIARDTAWKDYARKTALSAELLKLAEEVHVS
jgi:TRAP-type C4-dicarboxylate transport system substrate-binding protein